MAFLLNKKTALISWQTLLSHSPKQKVSSGFCAFIALFGMGRDGPHKTKLPENQCGLFKNPRFPITGIIRLLKPRKLFSGEIRKYDLLVLLD